jgi:hypothetical protein
VKEYSLSHEERQFWRESEGRWVNHVNIITWGISKDKPTKWRHRTVTTTVTTTAWKKGKS